MAYIIKSENINEYNEASFEDYKDRLVYRLFKKYKKVEEYYSILRVREHIDKSFIFFRENKINQLKNLEFLVETEFVVGFSWYEEGNNKILDKVDFSLTKFGELNFIDTIFEIFESFYNEIIENNYSKFEMLFKRLNDSDFYEYYKKEFPVLSSFIDVENFYVKNISYNDKSLEKLFFSFLRSDQWLVI